MSYRVLRGGSYFSVTWGLRTSFRYRYEPVRRNWSYGFRLVVKRRKKQ